ncbi:hypothetical protein ACWCPF_10585 [Streptomyces sp. NPDC001858]
MDVSGRVGHLWQEGVRWRPGLSVLVAFAYCRPGGRDEHADRLPSPGLPIHRQLALSTHELSYEQRRRIERARLVSERMHLLLLGSYGRAHEPPLAVPL